LPKTAYNNLLLDGTFHIAQMRRATAELLVYCDISTEKLFEVVWLSVKLLPHKQ